MAVPSRVSGGADAIAWGIEANEVNSAPIGMRDPEKPAVDAVAVRGWVISSVETVAGTVVAFNATGDEEVLGVIATTMPITAMTASAPKVNAAR
jgi:hypothetical protein